MLGGGLAGRRGGGEGRGKQRGWEWSTPGQIIRDALSQENLKTIIKLTKRQFAFSYHHEPVIRALSVIKHPSHHWVDKCHTPTHSPCASLIKAFVQGPAVKLSGNCKDKGQGLACKGDIHLAGERTLRPQSPGRTVRLLQIRPSPVPGRSRPGPTSARCAGFSLLRAEPASHRSPRGPHTPT